MRQGNCVECGNPGQLYGGEVCPPCAQQRRIYLTQQGDAEHARMTKVHRRLCEVTAAAKDGDCGEAQRRQILRDLAVMFQDDDVVQVLAGTYLECLLNVIDVRKLHEAADRLRDWRRQLDATNAYRMSREDVARLAESMEGIGQGGIGYVPPRARERHVEHWTEAAE